MAGMDVAVLFFHQEKAYVVIDAKPVRPLTKNALDFEVLNAEILQSSADGQSGCRRERCYSRCKF